MRSEPVPACPTPPRRAASLTITATTLVALVAMSATIFAAPSPRAIEVEGRLETHVVRAMAAAVAAAARELMGAEQSTANVALLEPASQLPGAAPAPAIAPARGTAAPPSLLGERLLDLPPPTC